MSLKKIVFALVIASMSQMAFAKVKTTSKTATKVVESTAVQQKIISKLSLKINAATAISQVIAKTSNPNYKLLVQIALEDNDTDFQPMGAVGTNKEELKKSLAGFLVKAANMKTGQASLDAMVNEVVNGNGHILNAYYDMLQNFHKGEIANASNSEVKDMNLSEIIKHFITCTLA